MKRLLNYLKSTPRKAWWLIILATLYAVPASYWFVCDALAGTLGKSGMIFSYLMLWQMVWILIMALPLFYRPLGDWVFRRNGK